MRISVKRQIAFVSCLLGTVMMSWAADVPSVSWDATSLIIDGRRVCPVMGEIHYSRIPQSEWQQEVRKMKDGGVTIIATYVFWNHVEEQQGIFRWDGQRDLRQFLEVCKAEQMPVVLRIGPFCHGEVRCGGIPDWMYNPSLTLPEGEGTSKPIRMRSEDPRFLFYVERLYRQIFTQVQGLQWKDGGPVMACQFDNEYRGRGSYLMALKQMALRIGFDLPFYTRTGWPELATPVPYGEMLPLYGDYAELLAPMAARFPCEQDIAKGDDSHLRWSVREKDGSGFIFINNYERLQNLSTKRDVQLEACGVKLPKLTIPAGTMCILPVNIDGIRYATAQLVAKRNGKIYMQQIKGIPTTIVLENGKTLRNVKARDTEKPVWQNIYLLSTEDAEHLFLDETPQDDIGLGAVCEKIRDAGPLRTITMGVNKVAEEPTDEDFEQAAVYRISVPNDAVTKYRRLLQIDYRGDVARLYCNGQLIADNFYNGRPMLFGLWRLPAGATELELRILPLQENMPIYFPREADTTPGEQVNNVIITYQGL